MCDFFWQRMENNTDQGGDLSDIIRSSLNHTDSQSPTDTWQPRTIDSGSFSFQQNDFVDQSDVFSMRDQFLHENTSNDDACGASNMKIPGCNNIFSRVLQISPVKHSPVVPIRQTLHHDHTLKIDHTVQISSPRAPSGIKRRKSQGKKVVCVPAPAAASSRSSGEVVPSDLWAWRKYGQKPIKGSPYPRGYYRCSSSKGCPARKQVERSRTDPNMLVITYTSDHNHPWPTQRNALAGSTRFQPSKTKINGSASSSSSNKTSTVMKDRSPKTDTNPKTINVKEEVTVNEQIPMDNDYTFDQDLFTCGHNDDFFADLAELESDPMSLIFTTPDDEVDQKPSNERLDVDPFVDMFDNWGNDL